MAAFLGELFPTAVAYSGVSLGYSLGAVLGGHLSPFIASLLMRASDGAYWSVSLYLSPPSVRACWWSTRSSR